MNLTNLFEKVQRVKNSESCVALRTRSRHVDEMPMIHPFVSASDLQNFCLDDHFSDFLDLYVTPPDPHPLQPLFDLGIQFESKIIDQLRKKTGMELSKMSRLKTSRDYVCERDSTEDFKQTWKAMQRGDPIIYSAYLWHPEQKVHGIPDLLVRNDALMMICDRVANRPARESLFGSYYYIPVEIKYSTLHLVGMNQYLTNSGRLRYYKTQLMMYSRLLADIQGVFPCVSYIIGKRVVNTDKSEHPGELHNLGFVDYTTKDSMYAGIFDQAVSWMKRVKTEGREWRIGNFPRELYPNMKVVHPYHQTLKGEWAEHLHDITQLWRCSSIHRENARRHKVYSWDDMRCNSETLGMSGSYGETVDLILQVNRMDDVPYLPQHLPKVVCPYGGVEENMYVDFETLVDLFGDEGERIFMIGLWYKGKYHFWLMQTDTADEEVRIMRDFFQFWEDNGKPNCLYWYAEKGFWDRAVSRNNLPKMNVTWIDLHEPWVSQRIVVKGALNFKLKSLIRAMRKLGLTDLELPPDSCDDGLQAMRMASSIYSKSPVNLMQQFAPILHYNELDCRYVHFLYSFICRLKDC